ncbi:hypothetical protein [Taibaiella koreensis]|uniref:hypothetical protein n=1 Tax=Taibaiella koreensis TaxID=1268548 RepID=UPI000E59A95D|nr:hypothetical protein [Taibaiella koreensis]
MKTKFLFLAFYFMPFILFAQARQNVTDSNSIVSFGDMVYVDEVNGMNVFANDTLYHYIGAGIDRHKETIDLDDRRYPTIYMTNKDGSEFLEIWGAPDILFRQFYTIGYTQNKKCAYCGTNIGPSDFRNFYVNKEIRLGDDLKSVWAKVHLNFYRRFKFSGVDYFYFEQGVKHELPFMPERLF